MTPPKLDRLPWKSTMEIFRGNMKRARKHVERFVKEEILPRLISGMVQAIMRYPDIIDKKPVRKCAGVAFPLPPRKEGKHGIPRIMALMISPTENIIYNIQKMIKTGVNSEELKKNIHDVLAGKPASSPAGKLVETILSAKEMFINAIMDKLFEVSMMTVEVKYPLVKERWVVEYMEDYEELARILNEVPVIVSILKDAISNLKDAIINLLRAGRYLERAKTHPRVGGSWRHLKPSTGQ